LILSIIFFEEGIVVPIVYTSLSIVFASIIFGIIRYVYLAAEKKQLKTVFEKYVSEEVLTDILKNPQDIGLGGKEYTATILFSDIRGFTTFSEKMTPKYLIQFLNRYLTQMTNIILDNRGVIDKYIGDAIMAFWGAPIVSDAHAYQAILSAVAMIDSLKTFNEDAFEQFREPIAMGIGLNTGSMIAGNIGSEKRFDYTAIGDSVNLASRLESQTKHYGVSCIASEYTIRALTSDQQQRLKDAGIRWREIDRLVVKGKVQPVTLFEIFSPLHAVDTELMRNSFEQMYRAYTNAQWDLCITQAKKHLAQWNDTPATIILERAQYYTEHPTEWAGYYVAKNK
jgi:adenylate cyclase